MTVKKLDLVSLKNIINSNNVKITDKPIAQSSFLRLVDNKKEIGLEIKVTFGRNNFVQRKTVTSLKDFVYLYLDLIYNNDTIFEITLNKTI